MPIWIIDAFLITAGLCSLPGLLIATLISKKQDALALGIFSLLVAAMTARLYWLTIPS